MAEPDPQDLTARARIRDAALRLFGEQGFDQATIRGIAEAAGVSSGLVRHHYGSKEALREACDTHLARMVRSINDQVRADTALGSVNHTAVALAAFGPYRGYITRPLVEGRAVPLFDHIADASAQWLAEADRARSDPPGAPPESRAAVLAAMSMAVGLLHEHVSRRLGVDLFSPAGGDLLARILLDLYSHPLLSPEEAAVLRSRLPGREEDLDA
jgi:AcrR family transcriptional regulator